MKKHIFILSIFALFSCNNSAESYDASGTFEADEILVTSKANGTILNLNLEEGQHLKRNEKVGEIDPKNVELQKEQVIATIDAIDQKTNSALPQIQVLQSQISTQSANVSILQEQLQNAVRERNRTANLVAKDAATKKQLDDANGQIKVIQKQIAAAQSQLSVLQQQISTTKENVSLQNRAILSERKPTQKKIEQIDEQLKNNSIESPISGMVLTQYLNQGEFATVGKPIFKIANLEVMTLKTFITGDQLPQIKIGQQVKVLLEAGEGKTKELPGTIYWISSKAEFTPKTIQTKNERANLVYAAKIHVKNDGYLKIGMYGDVKF
ncbi:MAG TPA: HlyD family efflux transporter periplasmic adaptor subunit [Kaistella chaponensis]|uniref:HlyD family secretion protein n=1 Tax=Kaistella chaponensis TaxID=713588 RepID=UPI002C1CBEE1|nr:HlyD family efflux transporter periplasmic adaptor subunit [Kaistella chaponensis]HPW88837.1 HlyD family efflux transporter periplasmic adaptor subunit [Kaistella chaponensis]HQC06914.1 HlyD family efflux transporter periplasmic adaptor subunit [Kaistella chaponensis]